MPPRRDIIMCHDATERPDTPQPDRLGLHVIKITMNKARTLSRRRMLAGMAHLPLFTVADWAAASEPRERATFVMVHGAWHGGWCWRRLTPLLRAAGHDVYTPTLTGLGERSHLLTPAVELGTHLEDIIAVLEYENLQDVVLVGHSYGGMVIAGVADKLPERVVHLVYLDAFLPQNGKAIRDYAPLPPIGADGWRVPPPGPASAFGISDEGDLAWVQARLGDQPLRTLTQPVRLTGNSSRSLARTFIQCTEAPWFVEAAERAKQDGYQYRSMFSPGHDVMITQPEDLANLLLELV